MQTFSISGLFKIKYKLYSAWWNQNATLHVCVYFCLLLPWWLQVAVQDGGYEGATDHRGEAPAARAARSGLRRGQSKCFLSSPRRLIIIKETWDRRRIVEHINQQEIQLDNVLIYQWRDQWSDYDVLWMWWRINRQSRAVNRLEGCLKATFFQSTYSSSRLKPSPALLNVRATCCRNERNVWWGGGQKEAWHMPAKTFTGGKH